MSAVIFVSGTCEGETFVITTTSLSKKHVELLQQAGEETKNLFDSWVDDENYTFYQPDDMTKLNSEIEFKSKGKPRIFFVNLVY